MSQPPWFLSCMLSARAGEEALVEGAAAGADDYLEKQFSARELLARVENRLIFPGCAANPNAHPAERGRFRALVVGSFYSVYRMSSDWSEMRQLTGGDFLTHTEEPTTEWIEEYILPEDCSLSGRSMLQTDRIPFPDVG